MALLVRSRRRRGFPYRRRLPGVTHYGVEPTVTFAPGTPLGVRAWIALAPDFTRPWWEWNWADITAYVRWDPGVATSQGRRNQDTVVAASTARATLNNRDGRFSRLNPYSPYYGLLTPFTPIRFAVDPGTGFNHRYFGFVNSWPKRWDRSANDPTIPIVCRGPLHRVLRSQTLRSSLHRKVGGTKTSDIAPLAYWPMEDAAGAVSFASAVGGSPMVRGNHLYSGATGPGTVTFAAESTLPGSQPLPIFGPACSMKGPIPAYTDTGQWVYQIMLRLPFELDSQILGLLDLRTTNTNLPYVFVDLLTSGVSTAVDIRVRIYDATVALTDTFTGTIDDSNIFDQWVSIVVCSKLDGSGGNDTVTLSVLDTGGSVLGTTGAQVVDANFHGAIAFAEVLSPTGVYPAGVLSIGGAAWGHAAVYTDTAFTLGVDDVARAVAAGGHVGEMAHERIGRLCAEEQITLHSTAATSAALGPQPAGKLLTVLQDSAKAAQGVLYEYEFGLAFQDVSDRYNQSVAMTIDIAQGQVVEDLEPADDDLRFHNQWTASRPAGSSVTVQADGALTDADLVYDGADTFQLQTDAQLAGVAGWLLHTDTVEEDYWPNVAVNLAKHPALIPDWLALPYGARINVTNLMSEAGVDTIDAIVEGHMEHFNSLQWSARLNTSPASVYTVGVIDSDQRLDSATSTFAVDISDSAVSLSVATSDADELWTTDSAQMPFDIEIWPGPPPDTSGGEVMTVTAISGASSPQTFTVTRAVNGVVKAHAAGAEVHVRYPIVLAY